MERDLLSVLSPMAGRPFTVSRSSVFCGTMEKAQRLLNRSPWDSHPLLLASKATHQKFTHFQMTTLQVLENNNLVPLQTSLLLATRPQFLQNGKNRAIPDYLLYMPSASDRGCDHLQIPCICIADRETAAQGIEIT